MNIHIITIYNFFSISKVPRVEDSTFSVFSRACFSNVVHEDDDEGIAGNRSASSKMFSCACACLVVSLLVNQVNSWMASHKDSTA